MTHIFRPNDTAIILRYIKYLAACSQLVACGLLIETNIFQ